MMASQFESYVELGWFDATDARASIISSKPFKFLIGKNRSPVYVHNSLIAQNSSTLSTLMNGGMSESQDGVATLDDVEVDTFASFAEWLYTGRYSSVPTSDPITDSTTVGSVIEQHGLSQHFFPTASDVDLPLMSRDPSPGRSRGQNFYSFDATKRQMMWATFTGGSSARMPQVYHNFATEHVEDSEPRNGLMPHVKMYCFADKYGVSGLQQLTIDKIKQSMVDDSLLLPSHVTEIVDMIWYTLEHTTSPSSGGSEMKKVDKLRDLVFQYATIIIEILYENEDFKTLYSSDGDFALELMGRLLGRLD